MPTFERRSRPPAPFAQAGDTTRAGDSAQAGYTYLLLLFALAIGAAGLAALGERWQVAAQRAREAELLFRGRQISTAIERWAAARPDGTPAWPQSLDALLADQRRPGTPLHHLRRLYTDPFTGQADWVLLRDAQGGIYGVHSRARAPALRRHAVPADIADGLPQPVRVGDWHFVAQAASAAPAAAERALPLPMPLPMPLPVPRPA